MKVRVPVAMVVVAGVLMGAGMDGGAPDLSSARASLLSVYGSLKAGDVEGAARCMEFSDPKQAEAFALNAAQVYAPLKLLRAAEGAFGEEARAKFAGASVDKQLTEWIEKAKTVEISEEGETATVGDKKAAANPNAETELTGIVLHKRTEGGAAQWKIAAGTFSDLATEIPAAQLPAMRAMREAMNGACEATIARLSRKEFKSAEEAFAAYQAAVQERLRKK